MVVLIESLQNPQLADFGDCRRNVVVETDDAAFDGLERHDGGEEFGLGGQHEDCVFLDGVLVEAVVLEAGGVGVCEGACEVLSAGVVRERERERERSSLTISIRRVDNRMRDLPIFHSLCQLLLEFRRDR